MFYLHLLAYQASPHMLNDDFLHSRPPVQNFQFLEYLSGSQMLSEYLSMHFFHNLISTTIHQWHIDPLTEIQIIVLFLGEFLGFSLFFFTY